MPMRVLLATFAAALTVLGCSSQPSTPWPQPAPPPAPLPTSAKPASATPPPRPTSVAVATLRDLAGARVGSVTFTESYAGVIVAGNLNGLGLGAHAIHVHEFGKCQAPFTTAGSHFNPQNKHHGFLNPDGPHAGDLPNID